MRQPKKNVFAITMLLLAIGSIAAAKARKSPPQILWYGTQANFFNKVPPNHCKLLPYFTRYTAFGMGPRGTYQPNDAGPIFLLYTNSTCSIPAYYNAN